MKEKTEIVPALVQNHVAPVVDSATLSEYLKATGNAAKLTEQEQAIFMQIAMAYGLNPFKREIYVVKYSNMDMSVIVGYEVYLKRAERTGLLAGWSCVTEGSVKTGDLRAICTIYRKDREQPFVWESWYDECVQTSKDGVPNKFWREKPRHMVRKVGISQAFRLAFPDEIGGMPYTSDEIQQEPYTDAVAIVEPPTKAKVELKPKPAPQPTTDAAPPSRAQAVGQYEKLLESDLFSGEEKERYGYQDTWNDKELGVALKHISKLWYDKKNSKTA